MNHTAHPLHTRNPLSLAPRRKSYAANRVVHGCKDPFIRVRLWKLRIIRCLILLLSLLSVVVRGQIAPVIGAVTPSTNVLAGTPVLLWATNIVDGSGISNVWCVITPPDYDGTADPPQTNLTWNAATSRYEASYTNFTEQGAYSCMFYALDNLGLLSSAQQCTVTVTDPKADAYEPDNTPTRAWIFPIDTNNLIQLHNFHSAMDEDWVKFYAPTGFVFNIDATQLGTNSDLVLDLYYEQPDGTLSLVDFTDNYGRGSNVTETLTLDLRTGLSGLSLGVYYVRVSSADTNLFGPGSDYSLQVYVPAGPDGGLPWTPLVPIGSRPFGKFCVYMDPPQALAAGAGWRITEFTNLDYYSDAATYGLPIPSGTNYHLAFRSIPGFAAPTNRPLVLVTNQTTNIQAYYVYTNLSPLATSVSVGASAVFNLTYLGYAGKRYAIEESTNLFNWVPLVTNQIPQDGLLRFAITNAPTKPRAFYRAHLIP